MSKNLVHNTGILPEAWIICNIILFYK